MCRQSLSRLRDSRIFAASAIFPQPRNSNKRDVVHASIASRDCVGAFFDRVEIDLKQFIHIVISICKLILVSGLRINDTRRNSASIQRWTILGLGPARQERGNSPFVESETTFGSGPPRRFPVTEYSAVSRPLNSVTIGLDLSKVSRPPPMPHYTFSLQNLRRATSTESTKSARARAAKP